MTDDVDLRSDTLQRVAEWLWASRQAVVEAWGAAVRADPRIRSDRSISYADFVDHIPNVLDDVCRRLGGAGADEERAGIRREAGQHGFLRWRQGYDLAELLREIGHLRQALIEASERARQALDLSPEEETAVVRMAFEVVDEGQVATVLSYVAERDREARERDARIAASDEALRDTANRLQQTLLEQERGRGDALEAAARTKDEFLATLSHELRTPLTPILAWTAVLERTALPAPVPRAVGTIGRNARVLGQLIDDLLDVSRIVNGKLEMTRDAIDARSFVRAARDTLQAEAATRKVRLVLREPRAPVPVTGDAMRLQQVVWNLLSNAVKFSPPGAKVTISVHSDHKTASVAVVDRGEGIDPAFLPSVFDRFRQQDQGRTRGHGGLGLGLAIARAIVDEHGGQLSASSEGSGRGARFELRLPLRDAPAIPAA